MHVLDEAFREWQRTFEIGAAKAWPYRGRPRPDELLSSWFLRCAEALRLKPYALANGVWRSRPPILTRDIDNMASPRVVAGMAALTSTPLEQAWRTTLQEFEGRLVEHYTVFGRTTWILPLGVRHRNRTHPGLQFCPTCLAEEPAYFRRTWRLAWVTVCVRHRCGLEDRCPMCGVPLAPHRADRLFVCAACGADFRSVRPRPCTLKAAKDQAVNERRLERGWGWLGPTVFSYSHLYFEMLRQIAKLVVTGQRADRFRAALCGPDSPDALNFRCGPIGDVETLPIDERSRMMRIVSLALIDWPDRFVLAARESGLWKSWAMRDRALLPFAFTTVVDRDLRAGFYQPPDAEIRAAESYLVRARPVHTREDLRRLVGDCRAIAMVFAEGSNPSSQA